MTTRQPQPSSRFSSKTYLSAIALLAWAGLIISTYLAVSHYRNFMDIGYRSFCAISRSLNCDTVSQSSYAVFLGVPVAVWGCICYTFFFIALLLFKPIKEKSPGFACLCILTVFFSMGSVFFALVSSFLVRSYCIMCMATYGINFMLMMLTWMAQKRFGTGTFFLNLKLDVSYLLQKRVQTSLTGAALLSFALAAIIFYPKYWYFPALPENISIHHGISEDGSPYIGAFEAPVLTIVEFADYMCFQCGKMHNHLRRLVSEYPDKIRLVHRHFPLDRLVNPMVKDAFHEKSSLLSLFAIYAAEQGKFWEVNNILFREAREQKKFNLAEISKQVGLDLAEFQSALKAGRLLTKLSADIQAGLKNGISVTPSYLIGGKLYSGMIPQEVFDVVLESKK